MCEAHPDLNVEKFGLQNARSVLVNAEAWSPIQFNLINAYRRNSSLVSLLVEVSLLRQASHNDVDTDVLKEFLENRLPLLARSNRTGEIIWLLFLAIRLEVTLTANRLERLYSMENGLVALLVACLEFRGLLKGRADRSLWDASLTSEGLRGPMWPYAYEAINQDFLTRRSDNFIMQDDYFSLLRIKRVQFLNISRGYTSIDATLRTLRGENERMRRMREAFQEDGFDDFDDLGFEEEDGEISASDDIY